MPHSPPLHSYTLLATAHSLLTCPVAYTLPPFRPFLFQPRPLLSLPPTPSLLSPVTARPKALPPYRSSHTPPTLPSSQPLLPLHNCPQPHPISPFTRATLRLLPPAPLFPPLPLHLSPQVLVRSHSTPPPHPQSPEPPPSSPTRALRTQPGPSPPRRRDGGPTTNQQLCSTTSLPPTWGLCR